MIGWCRRCFDWGAARDYRPTNALKRSHLCAAILRVDLLRLTQPQFVPTQRAQSPDNRRFEIEPLSRLTIASWRHDARRDLELPRPFDLVVYNLPRLLQPLC